MESSIPPPPPAPAASDYPVQFSVDYPDRPLSRLSTFFRLFAAIPILILIATVAGTVSGGAGGGNDGAYAGMAGAWAGVLFLPALLMILFRGKYPRWWYDWNLEFTRFSNRVGVYLALMDDRYPSTDEQQAVHFEFPYPNVETDLNRGLPIIKWLLAIPHYIVLFFLYIAAFFVTAIAWFAILFTGRYPRGLFDFVQGVARWHNRVVAYAFLLVTDRYPPFRLSP